MLVVFLHTRKRKLRNILWNIAMLKRCIKCILRCSTGTCAVVQINDIYCKFAFKLIGICGVVFKLLVNGINFVDAKG